MKREPVLRELETIRRGAGGLLKAEDVVEFAKDENTALHNCFTWDDSTAAHQYRLWEARTLIRICVKDAPKEDMPPMRVYVSMAAERLLPGGGYRSMVEVLSDEEKRRQLLEQATREFEQWQAKYQQLSELASVFEAMNTLLLDTLSA